MTGDEAAVQVFCFGGDLRAPRLGAAAGGVDGAALGGGRGGGDFPDGRRAVLLPGGAWVLGGKGIE
jgi:hypothetical protein